MNFPTQEVLLFVNLSWLSMYYINIANYITQSSLICNDEYQFEK